MDHIRPYLVPITHNLPSPLPRLLTSVLGAPCYQDLLLDLNLSPNSPCLRLLISKALGTAILCVSSIVKLPQLLKLLSSRSAAGLSFPSYALETLAYLVSLAYNVRAGYAFSTYGETALIGVQNVGIAVLVLGYRGEKGAAAAFVAGLAVLGAVMFEETLVGPLGMGRLMAAAGVLGVASKLPQIWTVWREGGTGQLSAFAVFNYLVGSLSRIFTTLQEVDDKLILYGYVAGFVLNAILAAQMVYYWNSPQTASHAGEIGKGPEKMAMGSSTSTSSKAKTPTTRRRG